MSGVKSLYTIRECAKDILATIEKCKTDQEELAAGLKAAARRLTDRPDFASLGVKYQPNHIPEGKYLYYDGQLSIVMAKIPEGKIIPPHDHGTWEAMIVVTGRLRHTVFARADDGTRDGYAELAVADDRVLDPHDIAMVAPPAEIHSFNAVEGDCWVMVIVGENYKPNRSYYQPEKNAYVVRLARAASA